MINAPMPMINAPMPYCVWWIPQVPMKAFYYDVPDLETAELLTDALAQYDIFQYENRIKPDYCNAGGIQRYEDGEWTEVDTDEA